MIAEFRRRKPDVRVFLDRQDIDAGRGWQQVIFEALDDCRMVVAVYSPPYLLSKVCKEEFNIALFRTGSRRQACSLPSTWPARSCRRT